MANTATRLETGDPEFTVDLIETGTPEQAQRAAGLRPTDKQNLYLVHCQTGPRNSYRLVVAQTPEGAAHTTMVVKHVKWRTDRGEVGPENVTIESLLAQAGL